MKNRAQGLIRPYSSLLAALFRSLDVFLIMGCLWALVGIYALNWHGYFTIAAFIALFLYILIAEITGLYRSWRLANVVQELTQICLTWLLVVFALLIIGYATKTSSIYSRRVLLTWMVLTPVLLSLLRIALRWFLRQLRKRGRNTRTAVIAGAGDQALQIAREIQKLPWLGMQLLGFFDDHASTGSQLTPEFSQVVKGTIDELLTRAKQGSIDIVFIALPLNDAVKMKYLVERLTDTTVLTYVIPDLFISGLLHTRWGYMGDLPVLSIHDRPFTGIDGWLKRFEDIVFGTVIFAIIAIPMVCIAAAVKLTSAGPVLFKQRRYGISGEEIEVWKFRTMTVTEEGAEIKQAERNDARLTPIGSFLRRTSLDELPQFINVLQGYMSIVGPRPHAVAHNEQYRKEIFGYMLRHTIKPGITGWAQVNGWRGETDTLDKMEHRVEYDLWYIKNWSLWLDIKIIFATILHGFTGENAY